LLYAILHLCSSIILLQRLKNLSGLFVVVFLLLFLNFALIVEQDTVLFLFPSSLFAALNLENWSKCSKPVLLLGFLLGSLSST